MLQRKSILQPVFSVSSQYSNQRTWELKGRWTIGRKWIGMPGYNGNAVTNSSINSFCRDLFGLVNMAGQKMETITNEAEEMTSYQESS